MKPFIESIEFRGLEALRLNGPRGASAVVSSFGGQVLSWITPDGRERLFLSDRAVFDGSVPIRGGIPVCFPQFAGVGKREGMAKCGGGHCIGVDGRVECGEGVIVVDLDGELVVVRGVVLARCRAGGP